MLIIIFLIENFSQGKKHLGGGELNLGGGNPDHGEEGGQGGGEPRAPKVCMKPCGMYLSLPSTTMPDLLSALL